MVRSSARMNQHRRSSICMQRRQELGGYLPKREVPKLDFKAPELATLGEWTGGSNKRAVSTTMGFVSLLRHLLKDPGDRQAGCADCAG